MADRYRHLQHFHHISRVYRKCTMCYRHRSRLRRRRRSSRRRRRRHWVSGLSSSQFDAGLSSVVSHHFMIFCSTLVQTRSCHSYSTSTPCACALHSTCMQCGLLLAIVSI